MSQLSPLHQGRYAQFLAAVASLSILFISSANAQVEAIDGREHGAEISLEDDASGHTTVEVEIHGKKAHLLLDTGASLSCLDMGQLECYRAIKLASLDGGPISLGSSKIECFVLAPLDLKIGTAQFSRVPGFLALDLSDLLKAWGRKSRIKGILGAGHLISWKAVIDFGNRTLTVNGLSTPTVQQLRQHRPSNRDRGDEVILPLSISDVTGQQMVRVNLNGHRLNVVLDTGCDGHLILDSERLDDLGLKIAKKANRKVRGADGRQQELYALAEVEIDFGHEKRAVTTAHATNLSRMVEALRAQGVEADGIMGRRLLESFQATIDFGHRTLMLAVH